MQYLEETKMSKYRFAQESGISISTLYDIIKKEDYDIRESNIIKVSRGMGIGPFELFQKNEKVLVLQKMQEIDLEGIWQAKGRTAYDETGENRETDSDGVGRFSES